MFMKIFKVLFLLFPLLVFSNSSNAQQRQCGPRELIVDVLEQQAGEKLKSVGFVNPKQVIEVFVNKRTETWTILGSSLEDDGAKISCVLFHGKTWLTFEEPVGDPASF